MKQIEQYQIQYKNELTLLELNKIRNILLEEFSLILHKEKKEHDLFDCKRREKIKELLAIIQEVNEVIYYRKEKGFFVYKKDISWRDVSTSIDHWRNYFNNLIIPLNSNCSHILVDELIISCELENFSIANKNLNLTLKDLTISDIKELQKIDLNKILYDNYLLEKKDLSIGKYNLLLHYLRKRMSENHFYPEGDAGLLDTIMTKINNILTSFWDLFDIIIESKTDHA